MGKSRLAAELGAAAEARGVLVLRGACANVGDEGLPYGPIVEILGQLVRELDPERLETVVGTSGADLARLVPALDPGRRGRRSSRPGSRPACSTPWSACCGGWPWSRPSSC